MDKKRIENIFRNSNINNELFDAFQIAVTKSLDDVELYKILLGNPKLTGDEIAMYADKIAREFSHHSFAIFMWTAKMFEPISYNIESLEKSFYYYQKAALVKPTDYTPYIESLNLYNYDIEIGLNRRIIRFIEGAIPLVDKKSEIYIKLSQHYKLTGEQSLKRNYEILARNARIYE